MLKEKNNGRFCSPSLWLKQRCMFLFMEAEIKYICINRLHTSNSCLFHRLSKSRVCSSSKFVQVRFLFKIIILCKPKVCLNHKFGNTLEHQRIFIMANAIRLLIKMFWFMNLMLVIVDLISIVKGNRFDPFPMGHGGFWWWCWRIGPFSRWR